MTKIRHHSNLISSNNVLCHEIRVEPIFLQKNIKFTQKFIFKEIALEILTPYRIDCKDGRPRRRRHLEVALKSSLFGD